MIRSGPVRPKAWGFLPGEPWRRNQIAVNIAAALVFLGFNLVMPFLPFYVATLGVQGTARVALWSGLLLSVSPLLAATLGPLWGRLADRVGMRIMVQRVLFTIALHWGLTYFATNVWHLLGLRIFLGLFSGFGTMSVALVTYGCPRDRIGRVVGSLQATQILSSALGPLLGGILAHAIGIRSTFLLTCALCTAALLFVIALYRDAPQGSERPSVEDQAPLATLVVAQEGPVSAGVRAVVATPAPARLRTDCPLSFRKILALPMFLTLLPVLFLANTVDRFFSLIVPLRIASLAPPGAAIEALTGVVITAGALAGAASAYILGRLASRIPSLQLLSWSLLGGLVTIVPMAFCRSLLPFGTLRVGLGLSVGGALTLAYTIAGGNIPSGVRASAYGILSSTAMFGGSLGPILCSLLASVDLRAPFLFGGLLYVVLLLILLRVAVRARRSAWAAAVPAARPTGDAP